MFPSDSSLETQFTFESESNPLPEEPPFHILLLGDWSGKENTESALSKPAVIDRDNFDEVMAKFNVCLSLDIGGNDENLLFLSFNELDDFHPDNIFRQVPLFSELRELRRRLLNENTHNQAAAEVRSWFDDEQFSELHSEAETILLTDISEIGSENLLDSIINQTSVEKPTVTSHSTEFNNLLNSIVKPFLIQTDENEQARFLKVVDDATSDLMRLILHHTKFQELESAWRSVYLLVRKIETDVDLKIFLLDFSKDKLTANLKSVNSLADTKIYNRLITDRIKTPGGEPFAVVCGNYTFGVNVDDIAALIRLAKISQIADAPFISYILPEMLGITSLASAPHISDWNISDDSAERKLWTMLRSLPESGYLGFAMPKFLARLPYGRATDPAETFSFEEFNETIEHDNYLWANPSFICALLLAKTYRKFGWEMSRNFQLSLSDLPTHIYLDNGEVNSKPCAEILITETVCQKLLDEGIMPLISFKNSDRIQLGRFQSASSLQNKLNGKWT